MALPVFIYRRRFGGDKIQVNFVAFFCCAAHNISRLDSRENAVYSSDLCGEPEAQAEVSALVFFKRVFQYRRECAELRGVCGDGTVLLWGLWFGLQLLVQPGQPTAEPAYR